MPETRSLPSTLRAAVSAAFAVPLLLAATADAQEPITGSFALNKYEPTPIGDRFYAVPSGGVDGRNLFRIGLTLEYVDDPLLVRDTCRDNDNNGIIDGETECNLDDPYELGAVVSDQLIAHVGLSYALFERLLISLDLPLYGVNTGDSVQSPRSDAVIAAPDGSAVGDMRIGLRGQLFGRARGPAEIGLGAYLWAPTGSPEDFTGDNSVRFMPHLAVNGKMRKVVYSGQVGVNLRESTSFVNVNLGTELTYGAAIGILAAREKVQVGPELYGSTVIGNDVTPFKGRTTHVELLGSARYRAGDFTIGGALGSGLTHGIGSPQFRALATIAFAPAAMDEDGDGIPDKEDACPKAPGSPNPDKKKNGCPPDQDGDGVIDAQDACPTQPGVADPDPSKNGCPPGADRDGDGVADQVDACPDQPGAANPDPKRNGCPADRDADGVMDNVDACPDVAGPPNNQDPKKNGCPADRDNDTVPDAQDACPDVPGSPNQDPAQNGCPGDKDGDTIKDDQDACPNEKGAPDPDPKVNGCPKLVRVTQGAIKILQQVQFQLASAQILAASDALLTEVTAVLKDHPEIKKVRVDGHTDDKGPDDVNMRLSAERARAVKIWLVDHGIEETRLDSAGFGETKPIGDNKTEAGAQQNRRVEFNIIDPAPPAGQEAPAPPAQPTLPPPPKKKAAPGGGQPPAGGQAPAAGGAAKPPAGGATPPAGGAAPPAGGAAPKPPAGGATPPAGGQPPAGGGAKPPATGAPAPGTAQPKPPAPPTAAPAPKTP